MGLRWGHSAPLLLPLRAVKATPCSQGPAAPSEHPNDAWEGSGLVSGESPREEASLLPGGRQPIQARQEMPPGWPDAWVVMVQVMVSGPR